jgi:protein-disulfide isomerase
MPIQPMSLTGAQILGSAAAKVGLVVYSDFQCPFCGKFARETLPAIQVQYVKSGKVLLAFREFPLPMHQFAQKAAEAAECAGRQGKFWPFHDELFSVPQALDPASLKERAQRLGLEPKSFATCFDGQTSALIQSSKAEAEPLGVVGTPTFLAGPILNDGRVKVSQRFSGALSIAEFQTILDRLVSTASAGAQK